MFGSSNRVEPVVSILNFLNQETYFSGSSSLGNVALFRKLTK